MDLNFIGKTANILCRLSELVETGTINVDFKTFRKDMQARPQACGQSCKHGFCPPEIAEEALSYLGNNPDSDSDFGLDEARRPTNAEDPVNLSVEFKNRFLYLSKNNIDYDCEFQVYPYVDSYFAVGDPVFTFKAHKFLFAAASEVFREMFQKTGNSGKSKRGNGSCSKNIKPDDIFIIEDMEADGFKNMRHFIYTGEVTFSSTLNALSTFLAARKYIIPALCKECINYMVKNIKREELINLFASANALKVQSEFEELFKKKEIPKEAYYAQDFE